MAQTTIGRPSTYFESKAKDIEIDKPMVEASLEVSINPNLSTSQTKRSRQNTTIPSRCPEAEISITDTGSAM